MQTWVINAFLAIPDANNQQLLILSSDNGWTFPHFVLGKSFTDLHLLQRAIRERLHAEMTVIRWANRIVNEEAHTVHGLWIMEVHSPDWSVPDNGRWVSVDDLDDLTFTEEWMKPALIKAFGLLNDSVETQPWFSRGWFTQVQQWITDTLVARGYTLVGVPEQFKIYQISSLLRAETTQETFYFKCAIDLPLFGNEPALMQSLGDLYPRWIPKPLAIDAERRWMLAPDFGVMLFFAEPDVHKYKRVVTEYAQLQRLTSEQVDTLLSVGCLDRRLPILASQIDGLLADRDSCRNFNSEELVIWQNAGDHLRALCDKLASYNVPMTLVHGDFHAGNIAVRGDDILFFDWTDACLAHPFFDLALLMDGGLSEEEATQSLAAYLSQWESYETPERLREAYQIAEVLAFVHQAVSGQGIRDGVNPADQDDMHGFISSFTRIVFDKMQALSV